MEKTQGVAKRLYWRRLWVAIGVILMSMVLAGCGTLQTLVQKDGEATPLSQWIGSEQQTVPATTNLGDGKAVNLYFPDSTGKTLVKEERTLPKTVSVARETINEWLKGPVQGKGQAAVAPATTLRDIAIKDGVATVDLSKEFAEPFGKVSQELAVYGLVNTLTQFPTVHEVKIRVEGKPLTKLGNLDLNNLSYKEGIVKDTATPSVPAGSSGTSNKAGQSEDVKAKTDSPSRLNLFSDSPITT
jgi:hypothetical protein